MSFPATWEALQFPGWNDQQLSQLQAAWQKVKVLDQVETSLSVGRIFEGETLAKGRSSRADMQTLAPFVFPRRGTNDALSVVIKFFRNLVHAPNRAVKNVENRHPPYWTWKYWWSYEEELFCDEASQIAIEAARRAKSEKCFAPALQQVQAASERLGKM